MKFKALLFTLSLGALLFTGCKKDEPSLGDAPTTADAQFTYEKTAANPNIVVFTATNKSLIAKWDFGNGTTAEGTEATGEYPLKGTYTVKLTVFNSGGSASSTQEITIDEDDASLLNNPLYTLLTGGTAGVGYKTWVIDSTRAEHMGVGPNSTHAEYDGDYPKWWKTKPLEKTGSGLYNDNYVFHLEGFKFDMNTGGDVYINDDQAGNFSGSFKFDDDYTAPYEDRKGLTWTLTEGEDTTLTISGDGFIGFYTGVRTYKIVSISENELFLQYLDAGTNNDAPILAWYIRLVPDDLAIDTTGNGGGNNDPKFTLPLDFESVEPIWEAFGGSTYQYIDNPDASGINTSSRVLETVHGNEPWAGLFVNLESAFDFSTKTSVKIKLWAPTADTMRLKLENSANKNDFVERDVAVSAANQWVELVWDFSDLGSTPYDRLVIFPGWNVANTETFYVDDIIQE